MRRMYSKKQLEELISQMSGDILEVKNVKQLNDEQCNGLKVGDIVAKKTGKQYHCYIVTFKQDKGGLCLSYFDASCIETQSYDYTAGHWVYNSEDKTALVNVEAAPTGEIQDVLGLDAENKLVKGAVSGGTKLYLHNIPFYSQTTPYPATFRLRIINNEPEPITDFSDLATKINTSFSSRYSEYFIITPPVYSGNALTIHYIAAGGTDMSITSNVESVNDNVTEL